MKKVSFLTAILIIAGLWLIGSYDVLGKVETFVKQDLGFSGFGGILILGVLGLTLIIVFIKLLFASICGLAPAVSRVFPSSGQNTNCSNIQNVLKYRNSTLGNMSNEKAASEYMKTGWLDGLMSNSSGKNTSNTVNYINSKLGTMSNEEGMKWVKSKSK